MPLPSQSPEVAQAIRVIQSTYGDTVSIEAKKKNLNKFGVNALVGTSYETIAQFQSTESNETFVTTNLIDSISSSSASDTTQTIVVEGHTVDLSGNLTFVSQEAVLVGQTKVVLGTPLARANRAYVKSTGTALTYPAALVGTVYIYDDTAGVASGVPSAASATKLLIAAGETSSQKCATSISSADYFLITSIAVGVTAVTGGGGTAERIEARMEIRDVANGGPWKTLGTDLGHTVSSNPVLIRPRPYLIVPKNHDIRMRARSDSSTVAAYGEFAGMLASVV